MMSTERQLQVLNPQVAQAPGEEALEAASAQAMPSAAESDDADIADAMVELTDRDEYVDEP